MDLSKKSSPRQNHCNRTKGTIRTHALLPIYLERSIKQPPRALQARPDLTSRLPHFHQRSASPGLDGHRQQTTLHLLRICTSLADMAALCLAKEPLCPSVRRRSNHKIRTICKFLHIRSPDPKARVKSHNPHRVRPNVLCKLKRRLRMERQARSQRWPAPNWASSGASSDPIKLQSPTCPAWNGPLLPFRWH